MKICQKFPRYTFQLLNKKPVEVSRLSSDTPNLIFRNTDPKTHLENENQLLEFKNAKMVKKKEIENEENRYKLLLSMDNQV